MGIVFQELLFLAWCEPIALKSPFSTTCQMGSYLGSLSFTVLTSLSLYLVSY